MGINSYEIVAAFKRNCPKVRLTKDEEKELARLIKVYGDNRVAPFKERGAK